MSGRIGVEFGRAFLKPQLKEIRNEINCRLLSRSSCSLPACGRLAQSSPSEKAAETTSSAPARNDVYHVYFGKAAAGKAAQLAELLKTPNPKDAMPGILFFCATEGDAWDYCLITHIGAKATVEATPFQVPAACAT